jgi:transcription elongation factor GreB
MKNYITPSGFNTLKAELKDLLTRQRPELVSVIAWAASNGDRSENGDYIYGKRKLREIDRRIRFLSQRLESAEVIDLKSQDPKRVLFGAFVVLGDEEGEQKRVRIVGQDEIQLDRGWISWQSPIARAVLGAKVGDVVSAQTPKGVQEFEVLEVSYEQEGVV